MKKQVYKFVEFSQSDEDIHSTKLLAGNPFSTKMSNFKVKPFQIGRGSTKRAKINIPHSKGKMVGQNNGGSVVKVYDMSNENHNNHNDQSDDESYNSDGSDESSEYDAGGNVPAIRREDQEESDYSDGSEEQLTYHGSKNAGKQSNSKQSEYSKSFSSTGTGSKKIVVPPAVRKKKSTQNNSRKLNSNSKNKNQVSVQEKGGDINNKNGQFNKHHRKKIKSLLDDLVKRLKIIGGWGAKKTSSEKSVEEAGPNTFDKVNSVDELLKRHSIKSLMPILVHHAMMYPEREFSIQRMSVDEKITFSLLPPKINQDKRAKPKGKSGKQIKKSKVQQEYDSDIDYEESSEDIEFLSQNQRKHLRIKRIMNALLDRYILVGGNLQMYTKDWQELFGECDNVRNLLKNNTLGKLLPLATRHSILRPHLEEQVEKMSLEDKLSYFQ